jgi:multicomponent Na+:H+ antiporter subunit D
MTAELFGTPIPPAVILIVGGLILPLFPRSGRLVLLFALPLLSLSALLALSYGEHDSVTAFGHTLVLIRLDSLSFIFAFVFHIAIFLSVLYASHVRDPIQESASLVYPGAALGAVLAGDLVSFLVFVEIMAVASALLIWAGRSEPSFRAGSRYLAIHVFAGALFLLGVVVHVHATGSLAFTQFTLGTTPGAALIFASLGIKAAFPLLHNWVQDSYPKATATGTLVLSIFTTKLAVYALARGFSGSEVLIPIGAAMTAFPVFFAVIENDLRRVLCYSLNNQVGFMVAAIGVGTPLALNGVAGYAFCNVIFEALLFMAMGAVFLRTGTAKATDLGGLWRSMPLSAFFCIIGALSISAFPLFSGFVAKGMIMDAVVQSGHTAAFLVLLFASAGVLEHAGIKVPYFAFFAPSHSKVGGKRVAEAPIHMLLAMAIAAAISIAIGVAPQLLYDLLPHKAAYQAYTPDHIITQLQLLMFAILAFVVLMRTGLYPAELRAVHLDIDWLYRRLIPQFVASILKDLAEVRDFAGAFVTRQAERLFAALYRHHGPSGILARTWPTGSMVLWVTLMLAGTLVAIYLFA